MKNKLTKDVLLIARPDHSMQIYRELVNQNELSFHFITFKVVREFVKKLIPYKKLQTVTKNCTIAFRPTFIQVCKKTFYFKFAQTWKTSDFLSPYTKKALGRKSYRLIHYWPEYAYSAMNDYIKRNNDTIILADMYMPNPAAIISDMDPIYKKYNLPSAKNSWLADYQEEMKEHFKYVTDIVVASSYVKKTMEVTFPNKKYHVISYGIPISPTYKKKTNPQRVNKFAYVGRISVEKGCDLMLDWFVKNPEREIHLYGGLLENQRQIFEKYWLYPNIKYHGAVSKEVLQRETPLCDVGILMSRFDAYAMAVGEMIGCGIPVIVSDHTGIMDDVRKYGFGIVADLNINSFEDAISQMDDPAFYSECCENIDKFIRDNHPSFGTQIIQLYSSLLKK